jgi:uncharacterized membrane protein
MNIHPAFVHFPIALLVLYTILELLPLARLWPAVQWNPIRKFLLYVGTLAIVPTIVTGLMAAQLAGESEIVEMHERAAFAVLGIFIAATLASLFYPRPYITKPLALLGLIGLFVVGSLGAAIVYGYDVDPIVSFITSILGLH